MYSGAPAALIGAFMRCDFKIEKLPMPSQKTTLLFHHHIGKGSGHKVTYPYYIPEMVHSHGYLIKEAWVLRMKKDIRQISDQP